MRQPQKKRSVLFSKEERPLKYRSVCDSAPKGSDSLERILETDGSSDYDATASELGELELTVEVEI
jgi:hypothetical protein